MSIKEICGIEALARFLPVDSQRISIDTLIRLAEDNGIILNALHVSKEELFNISDPYILHHKVDNEGHYSYINSNEHILTPLFSGLDDKVYILIEVIPEYLTQDVISIECAKGIKGSKKKTFMGKFVRNVLPQVVMGALAPVTGGLSLLGAAGYGAWRGAERAHNVGGSSLMGGLTGAASGLGYGMLGSGLTGAVSAIGKATTPVTQAESLFGRVMGSLETGAGISAVPSTTGQVTSGLGLLGAATKGFGAGTSAAAGQITAPFEGILGTGGATAAAGGAAPGFKGVMDLAKPLMSLGLGAAALQGVDIPTNPGVPQIGPIVSKWMTTDAVTRAGKLAQDIAETEWLGDFQVDKETQAFMTVQQKDIEKQFKRRHEDMDRMGLAINQYWMQSGERLEMHRRLGEEEQRETDMMRSEWLQNAKQRHSVSQYNYVMDQLNVDDAVKRELLYAEIADVLWKYNMEREDVLKLRELAQEAGIYGLTQAQTQTQTQTQ